MAWSAAADTLRVATWHVELEREGPGLLLRDIGKGAEDLHAVVAVLRDVAPDIVLLTGFDWDHGGVTLSVVADKIGGYPHRMALRSNAGLATGFDLDGDGLRGGAGDAQGFGDWHGQGSVALLSRHPMTPIADHTTALWSAQDGALLFDGITPEVAGALRLFSIGLWEVSVAGLHLFALSATAPVFDGPEDRNGRRNHDQLAFLTRRITATRAAPLLVMGNANLDLEDGEGRKEALAALLRHPRLQDPAPRSHGGALAANLTHRGDPALDTADWDDPDPGNLRVSYVLPDAALQVRQAEVHWPTGLSPASRPRHKLVWVDLDLE